MYINRLSNGQSIKSIIQFIFIHIFSLCSDGYKMGVKSEYFGFTITSIYINKNFPDFLCVF